MTYHTSQGICRPGNLSAYKHNNSYSPKKTMVRQFFNDNINAISANNKVNKLL